MFSTLIYMSQFGLKTTSIQLLNIFYLNCNLSGILQYDGDWATKLSTLSAFYIWAIVLNVYILGIRKKNPAKAPYIAPGYF